MHGVRHQSQIGGGTMNEYLAKLHRLSGKAASQEKTYTCETDKTGSVSFVSDQSRPLFVGEGIGGKSDPEKVLTPVTDKTDRTSSAICAQCGGGPLTDPATEAPTISVTNQNGDVFLVHRECKRFWLAEQSGIARQTVH